MAVTMTNAQSRVEVLKRRLHIIMTEHLTIDDLKELVLLAGIASAFEVKVIQGVAIYILERSLTEPQLIEFNQQWEESVDNNIDCTIEELRAHFKIFA